MRQGLIRTIAFASLYFLSGGVVSEISASSYIVYERSDNLLRAWVSDYFETYKVLYILPAKSFLILHGDIATPIQFYPDGPAYTATLNYPYYMSSDAYSKNSVLSNLSQMVSGTNLGTIQAMCLSNGFDCVESSYRLHGGDFNGDGSPDLLLQGGSEISIVLLIHEDGSVIGSGSLGLDIRSETYSVLVDDVNDDGRDDINLYQNGLYIRTLLAGADGLFPSQSDEVEPDDQELDEEEEILTIDTTWNLFLSAMLVNNRADMNNYIDVSVQSEFTEIFDVLGAEVSDIADQIRIQKPYYISGDTAIYLLEKEGDDGDTYIHTITFKRQSNGSWKLYQL